MQFHYAVESSILLLFVCLEKASIDFSFLAQFFMLLPLDNEYCCYNNNLCLQVLEQFYKMYLFCSWTAQAFDDCSKCDKLYKLKRFHRIIHVSRVVYSVFIKSSNWQFRKVNIPIGDKVLRHPSTVSNTET